MLESGFVSKMTNFSRIRRNWSFYFLCSLISFIFCAACTDPQKEDSQSIVSFKLDDFTLIPDSSLSIDHWIPLETVATNLMGMDLRVKFADTLIFIMDESVKDGIHVFGTSGAYFKSIANVGEGPGEIRSVDDFEPKNNGLISVLSTIGDRSDVYTISLDGVLTKRFELNYVASSFADLNDQGFLFYGGFNLPFVTHRVIKTDTNGLIMNQYLENDYQNSMLPMSERNFFAGDSGIFMLETFNSQIYVFKGDSLNPILSADFGNYSLPPSFWEMDLMESFGLINQNGFPNFRSFFKNGENFLLDVMIQKGPDVFKYILIQHEGKKYKLRADLLEDLLYYYPIGITSEGLFAFITYKSILEKEKDVWTRKQKVIQYLASRGYEYAVVEEAFTNAQL